MLPRVGRRLRKQNKAISVAQKREITHLDYRPGGRASVSGAIVTVFGATGFLGRYVVNHLGSTGSQVVVPFRGEEKSYNHLKVMGDLGQIIPIRWDLSDKQSIRNAIEHSNVVINLVGRRWETRNYSFSQAHIESARNIAEVVKEVGVARFIHVSALNCEAGPSDWAKTKWEAEQTVRSIYPDATIIRPSHLWGAQDSFSRSHASMLRFWPFYPMFHAERKIQPVYVNDVAQGLVNTLAMKKAHGTTFEFAGPTATTHEKYIEWIREALKLPEKHIIPVSDNIVWHLGYWLGQHRNPRFTLDSIKENHDVILSGSRPGLRDCGITEPVSADSQTAVMYLNPWRKPSRQTDVTTDAAEIPELKDLEVIFAQGRNAPPF